MVTVVSLGGLGHAEVKLRTGMAGHCLRAANAPSGLNCTKRPSAT